MQNYPRAKTSSNKVLDPSCLIEGQGHCKNLIRGSEIAIKICIGLYTGQLNI